MKQGTFMDKHTKTFPPSTKQADSMDKLLLGPFPSMKHGIFMDKHTKTSPPSTKQADSMDKLLPGPLPSMKHGIFMDKHTKTFPPSTKQADSMDKLLPGPPSVHETRHFHGQTPGPRLHRHRAGGASPLAKLAQHALSGWPAYSPAALPPPSTTLL